MIGIDTNVLVRLFINDDERQVALVRSFFEQRSDRDPAYVSIVVLAEFMWVLERTFKFPRADALRAVAGLLEVTDIVIEQNDVVAWALANADSPHVDFADALIAEANRRAGAEKTVTFDKLAAKYIPAMELLK